MIQVARPGRFELPTLCLEGRRSIQLSYGRTSAVVILNHLSRLMIPIWRPLASAEGADALSAYAMDTSLATDLIPLKLQRQFNRRFFQNLGAPWSNWNRPNRILVRGSAERR